MAENPEEEGADAAPKSKMLPMIMAVCAALTVGAAGGMFVMLKRAPPAAAADAKKGEKGEKAEKGEHAEAAEKGEKSEKAEEGGEAKGGKEGEEGEGPAPVVTMSPYVVNVVDDTGESHYLKCTLAVEMAEAGLDKLLEQRTPKVRNAVLLYLSTLRVGDTEGVANKKKMLESLRETVQEAAGKRNVRDVYLTEFVIQ